MIRLARAECLVSASEPELAKEVLRAATEWLGKRARTIGNTGWQHAFLDRIPEHRRILELAREMDVPLDGIVAN
jgi:hypothetical protein